MNLSWFANVLVHHPYIILSAVAVFSGTCILIPFTLQSMKFPNFQDPEMGFSTRGTTISNRLTAWENLVNSKSVVNMSYSGLTTNPKEYFENQNRSYSSLRSLPSLRLSHRSSKKKIKTKKSKSVPVYGNVYLNDTRNGTETNKDAARWYAIKMLTPSSTEKIFEKSTDTFFCGNPDEKYAHLVVTSSSKTDLFTMSNILAMCRLEYEFSHLKYYEDLCIQSTKYNKCCKPWSLPNYIAMLNNRSSCLAIMEEDVIVTKNILVKCSQFFHNSKVSQDCLKTNSYCGLPIECIRHDTVFDILNFVTSTSFLPPNGTADGTILMETMIFLPLACSSAILPYYHELTKLNLEYGGVRVVAMDFGIKSTLFDEYLIQDAWLMCAGATFVFLCMWIYTQSLFLTVMTIIVIAFSLAISYFMYFLIFEIKFFPFMNVLATVVAIGIGSDDAFIFCKIWHIQKQDQGSSLFKIMTDTFQHAFITMFVTALTTTVAFLGSYVSCVTAISCFSIFAGTAVIANYVLMMTWFPACLVLWERSSFSKLTVVRTCVSACFERWCCFKAQWYLPSSWIQCATLSEFWKAKEDCLPNLVIKLKYFWLSLLVLVAVISGIIVFVYPKLQLPNTEEFQLFTTSHLFEQYDFIYKNHFWFKRSEAEMLKTNFKLPLRFVWGVLPVDNGDHLDPADLGTLVLDPTFDMSDPKSQEWLTSFCQNVRQQPFYQSMVGPLLQNCFIETFIKSMKRKCYDPIENRNRTPCCETSTFPFERSIFDMCIVEEIAEIYQTPSEFLNPVAGPRFSKDNFPTIKAVVVEYDSNYSYSMSYEHMHEFYTKVEEWMKEELKTAPDNMKNGWFISELHFYDLQRELRESTEIAVVMSMTLALIVLFLSTLNIFTSLYAIITITSSIFVTMAVLVLLGWKLNILESVAVSTAIGLTVDFSLHYSVNYRICLESSAVNREAATRHALSYMVGPALMAAITTGAAGAFMMPSLILPYIQIGIFLIIVMCISWFYATFLLGSLLAIAGPNKNCGQLKYSKLICCIFKKRVKERGRAPPPDPNNHELESLTYAKQEPTPKPLTRSLSTGGIHFTPSKYVFTDKSPSSTSAITIIMADDN